MPKFSGSSELKLSTCHEDLQELFRQVIKHYDCTIICGNRSQVDQDRAFVEGKSKVKWPNSKHNSMPSMAVDVVPYPIDWDDRERFYHFAGYVKGINEMLISYGYMYHTIRWGGDWDSDNDFKDNGFNDLAHFELIA